MQPIHTVSFNSLYKVVIMIDYNVLKCRTARTLYNKKDTFGVEHDTENQ